MLRNSGPSVGYGRSLGSRLGRRRNSVANDDERREAERLRDAWDNLAEGRPLPDDALDPSLGETIERLHSLYQPPDPDPTFISRLGQALMPTTLAGVMLPPHL